MTKLLTIFRNLEEYEQLKPWVDGFIIKVETLSTPSTDTHTKEEIASFLRQLKKDHKEVFLSFNKNMHEKELPILEDHMCFFDGKVTGYLYYDIAVPQIKKEKHLKTPLVWNQEHMTTNYLTANYWYQFGASYTMLSSEITLEEILQIHENYQGQVIVPVFGRIPIFTSKRHLVKNYLRTFHLESKAKKFQLEKEGKTYPIVDLEEGTTVYHAHCLLALKESLKLKEAQVPYFFLNPEGIDSRLFVEIAKKYATISKETVDDVEKEIETWLEGNTDKAFLYQETVYKVKK